ncbi:hypothetical protein DPMN_005305 [Dreissena polymorpha]|uniref:Uncharacterized protein n=1 Tax=Dreissena polymorpha TaxID=45954 RepID=A0A9D4MT93_DREPO|nr:hypothetical protein DPMN_005305 [Dreissena polymorpha]
MAKREGSRDFNIPRNNGSQVVHPQGVDISSGASENWRKKRKRKTVSTTAEQQQQKRKDIA